jgi:hypothetical protein
LEIIKPTADALLDLVDDIEKERGPLILFGLFLPEHAILRYDIVFSAPWIERSMGEAIEYLAPKVQEIAKRGGPPAFSGMMALTPDEPFVLDITEQVRVDSGRKTLRRVHFGEMDFDEVILAVCRPPSEVMASDASLAGVAP